MADESPTAVRTDPDSDRLKEVAERARKRMDAAWSVQSVERQQCLEDRRFALVRGAQWDDEWGNQFENAPRMEVNKTNQALVRIFSEYRNNRITVDFRPKDEEGSDEAADLLDGLFRADEEESGAQEAYDMAFDEAVAGGFGAWRLRACYEDETDPENDRQRIRFESIPDADQCVFFDPNSKRQDKADAKWAIVLASMTKEAFEEEHGEATPADFATPQPSGGFEWSRTDAVFIGEYYEVEEVRTAKVTLINPVEEDKVLLDPDDDEVADLEAEGWTVSARRKIKRPRVHKYLISGSEVLSDEGLIAGRHIPLVPVYGKRYFVENVERCAGHTRFAKDPARIYNAEVSRLAEIAGASPFERPIFDPEQVAGLEQHWADSNIQRHPYALARALRNEADGSIAHLGAIGKVESPAVPQSLAALIQISGQDVAEILGNNEQLDQVPANTSDDAIEMVHSRADAKTFIYIDNLAAAHRRSGEIWLSMGGELYVEKGRKMAALDGQGGRNYVKLGDGMIEASGRQITFDISKANMLVSVDVGPSSTTRRDATTRKLVKMAELAAEAGDMELANACISAALAEMDGEGIDDLKKWIRLRAVRAGIFQPTEEEAAMLAKEAENQAPDSQAMLAQGMTQQALAEAEKAKAGTIKTLADAEKIRVQIAEILAGVEREDRQQFIDALQNDADRIIQAAGSVGNGASASTQRAPAPV